ncbi:unnamed protein product, partial [Ectocarpus sp. 4 AP-2014]
RALLNSGTWTDDEHKGFLRGLEVYGHGHWNATAVFVLSRSPPQIEAHAQDYMAEKEATHNFQQVIPKPSGADHAASLRSGGGRCDAEFGGGSSSGTPFLIASSVPPPYHSATREQRQPQKLSPPLPQHAPEQQPLPGRQHHRQRQEERFCFHVWRPVDPTCDSNVSDSEDEHEVRSLFATDQACFGML